MISTIKECPVGEHESWAAFPCGKYKRILVHVAFLTAMGSLLVIQDAQGGWVLPREELKVRALLNSVPDRVIVRELGLQPAQLRATSFRQPSLLLGSADDEEAKEFHVFLRASVHQLAQKDEQKPGWQYVQNFEQLDQLGTVDPTVRVVAAGIGWKQAVPA